MQTLKRAAAGAVAAAMVGLGGMAGTATSASAAVLVRGQVMCVSQASVVGVWISASNGGSGWASTTKVNGYTKNYSYSLPNGGSYAVHVGCGGSPQSWATNNKSSSYSGTWNNFTCYDSSSAGWRYLTCQRT